VCILFCVGSKSEIFSCVHGFDLSPYGWSWPPARFSFLEHFHSGVFICWLSTRLLRPGPVSVLWSHARAVRSRALPQPRRRRPSARISFVSVFSSLLVFSSGARVRQSRPLPQRAAVVLSFSPANAALCHVFVAVVLGLASQMFPAGAPPRAMSLPHALDFCAATGLVLSFSPH
jgi:hypothetical protein